jgi:small subunit ribosomal protein S20
VPNKKAAEKAMAQAEKRRLRKRSTVSAVKTYIRNAERQIASGDAEAATPLVIQAQTVLDKAAEKGILHPNNAARRKSRLLKKLNVASTAAAAPVEEKKPTRRRTTTARTKAAGAKTTATKAAGTKAAGTTTRRRTTKAASS